MVPPCVSILKRIIPYRIQVIIRPFSIGLVPLVSLVKGDALTLASGSQNNGQGEAYASCYNRDEQEAENKPIIRDNGSHVQKIQEE
jgi:hypothetical protein